MALMKVCFLSLMSCKVVVSLNSMNPMPAIRAMFRKQVEDDTVQKHWSGWRTANPGLHRFHARLVWSAPRVLVNFFAEVHPTLSFGCLHGDVKQLPLFLINLGKFLISRPIPRSLLKPSSLQTLPARRCNVLILPIDRSPSGTALYGQ